MSATGALGYERCRGSGEWLLRIGEAEAPPILFVPPLFEEMNRSRALLAAVMRGLAGRGHGCWLIDLPGTGESEDALETATLETWRDAIRAGSEHVAAKSGVAPFCASVRGGALIDDAAQARAYWRFAPVAGASLIRDMKRAALAGGADYAGYPVSPALVAALEAATPAPLDRLRTVRLATDAAPADARLVGPALWRRSEPGVSPELANLIASDIHGWTKTCAAS